MTVISPPHFLTVDGAYDGADLGRPFRTFISEGVAGSTDLAVSERGAGANLSVDVAAGRAWISGDDSTNQPPYLFYNDATVNLAIAAADATNPRIDLVIAEIRDSAFSGVNQDARLRVVTGTPSGSPAAPATPNNAIVLARVSVPALDTTISNAQITDYRKRAMVGTTNTLGPATVTSLPTDPYDGQEIYYVADSANGIVWRFKYRSAASGSYKWECVGGPPLYTFTEGLSESTSSSTFTTLTSATQITVPLAGTYLFEYSCEMYSATIGRLLLTAVQIGSESFTTADHDYKAGRVSTEAANSGMVGYGYRLGTVTAANTVCRLVHKIVGGNTGIYQLRNLKITPVRVG